MASEVAIAQALDTIASAFNRTQSWVARCTPLWGREFGTRTDGQLDRALRVWIRNEAKAPAIADLHGLMDGEGRNGTPGLVNRPEACASCQFIGWRQAAWHRLDKGRLRAGTFALPCDCPLGATMGVGSVPRMAATLAMWRSHPATVAVHITDEDNPVLTKEERGVNAPVKPG